MKPDWKEAPDWANWLAQDMTGAWFWYEHRPEPQSYGSWVHLEGKAARAKIENPEWINTLTRRPR
jgi:hypothetical protein